MNRLTTIFYSICIFLCVPFLTKSQDFGTADSLFANQKFRDAYIEYERIIFLSNKKETKAKALHKKVQAYKQLHKFDEALENLEKFITFGLPDSLAYPLRYEAALCAYLSGDFAKAENQLAQIRFYIKDTALIKSALPVDIFVKSRLKKFDEAHKASIKYIKSFNYQKQKEDSLIAMANHLFSEENLPKFKSQKTGKWLSFFPGAGHIYAGYWGEGLMSFLLNASALSFGAYQAYLGYYVTGYLVGASLLQKFYFGAQSRTAYLIQKRNYHEMQKFDLKIKDFTLH